MSDKKKQVQEHNRPVSPEECRQRWGFEPTIFTRYQGTWTTWSEMKVSAMVEWTNENIKRAKVCATFMYHNPDGVNEDYCHIWFREKLP